MSLQTNCAQFRAEGRNSAYLNSRAPHIISTPCVVHRHALASEALQEYLKIILKHVTEHVNFIRIQSTGSSFHSAL